MRRLPLLAGTVALLAAGALAACTGDQATPPTPSPSASVSAGPVSPTSTAAPCNGPQRLASYAPAAGDANGYVAKIKKRGHLVAGVSADTLRFGARNSVKNTIEGFDIDVLHRLSKAIFGTEDKIVFAVITAGQREDAVNGDVDKPTSVNGVPPVDLVARTMSITCDRWRRIAFSSEYFQAGQRVLVARGTAKGIADLDGKRVCVPAGTSSLAKLKDYPKVTAVPVPRHTDCLADFQEGTVDAITGDDTVLAGFAAQDPYAEVVGDPFTVEPYGLAVRKDHKDFVQFINGVLEQMRTDGSWAQLYRKWLVPSLSDTVPKPPAAAYGRQG